MKVYILVEGQYMEGLEIKGVYTTFEQAEAARVALGLPQCATFDNDVVDFAQVHEWEVQA